MRSYAVTTSGAALLGTAAFLSGAAIERALLGSAGASLSWGPTLFRALLAWHGLLLVAIGVGGLRHPQRASACGASASGRSVDSRTWGLLVGLSVIALALRLWHLDSCLWFDEVLTLVDFVRMPVGQILTTFPSQNQHMLFSILAHASTVTLGESAWTLRLSSVGFGVASLWALFLLARRIVGTGEALLTCSLLTVSYHHVWFSQNARGYIGLMFFATFATWLWLEALARARWSWWFAYAVVLSLGMWIHLTMVFIPITHVLLHTALIVTTRLGRRPAGAPQIRTGGAGKALLAWLLAGTLTLQLYALALPQFLHSALHEVSLPSEWTSSMWVVAESVRSLRVGFGLEGVALCGALVALSGWLSIARRDWVAGGVLVLPPLIGGATMLVLGHNLWPRFFFFAIGFALLIAVHGATTVGQLLARALRADESIAHRVGIALAGLVIAVSIASLPRAYALPKQDFTGARDYVNQARSPGDAVVAVGLAGVAYQRYFAPDWLVTDDRATLDAVRRTHSAVWLVYTLPIEVKTYRPEIWDAIQNDFEVVKVFHGTLGDGDVNVCRERDTTHFSRRNPG